MKEPLAKTIARFLCFHSINLLSVCCKSRNSHAAISKSKIKNILIIDIGLLGDLLMTTPLIAGVKKCLPEAKITLVCTPWAVEAVKNNQDLTDVFLYEAFWEDRESLSKPKLRHLISTWSLIKFYRQNRYDLAFVVTARLQPIVTLLGYLSRGRFRIGIKRSLGDGFLTHSIQETGEHLTEMKLRLLNIMCPESTAKNEMVYIVQNDSKVRAEQLLIHSFGSIKRPFVCVTPSTLQIEKRWSIASWSELLNRLINDGIAVIIGGGKSDFEYNELIFKKVKDQYFCKQMTGKVSLNEFSALMLSSLCLVTVESAPMHLAAALNIPCVVLFSRIYDFNKFKPIHSNALSLYKNVECAGCLRGCSSPQCMAFTVDEVFHSTMEKLGPAR